MSLFSEIEKTIERGFHRFAERMFGPADSNELLLLHRAILAEVEGKVQIVARGRRVFPFARVVVTLVAAEAERRAILQAAFGERLGADIREAMDGSQCELPRGFSVEVRTAEAGLHAFDIEYSVEPVKAQASRGRQRARDPGEREDASSPSTRWARPAPTSAACPN